MVSPGLHLTQAAGAFRWFLTIRWQTTSRCGTGKRLCEVSRGSEASSTGRTAALFLFAEIIGVSGREGGCVCAISPWHVSHDVTSCGCELMALLCMDVVGDFWQRQRCWETNKDVVGVGGLFSPSLLLRRSCTGHFSNQRDFRWYDGFGSGCLLEGRRLHLAFLINKSCSSWEAVRECGAQAAAA